MEIDSATIQRSSVEDSKSQVRLQSGQHLNYCLVKPEAEGPVTHEQTLDAQKLDNKYVLF